MRSPADFTVAGNIGSLLETYFADPKNSSDKRYSLDVIITENGIPVGKIKSDSSRTDIFPVGHQDLLAQ